MHALETDDHDVKSMLMQNSVADSRCNEYFECSIYVGGIYLSQNHIRARPLTIFLKGTFQRAMLNKFEMHIYVAVYCFDFAAQSTPIGVI